MSPTGSCIEIYDGGKHSCNQAHLVGFQSAQELCMLSWPVSYVWGVMSVKICAFDLWYGSLLIAKSLCFGYVVSLCKE